MTDKQENNELTLIDCNKAIKLNPNDATAYINRAKYYYTQGNHELTLTDIITAIELNPDDKNIYYTLMEHYIYQGSFDLVLAILTKLIELSPNCLEDYQCYFYRAACYQEQGDNKLALAFYEKAIKLNPDYAPVYACRGDYYRTQKNYDLAIVDLNKAIKLDSSNCHFYKVRGECYYEQKIYLLAIVYFTKAIELNPNNASYYESRGACYFSQRNYELAIAHATKAIELEPDNAVFYNDRAICYKKLNNYELAIDNFTKAIKLEPDNAVFYGNRADCYEKINDYNLAMDDYLKADDLVEQDDNLHYSSVYRSHYEAAYYDLLNTTSNYHYNAQEKLRSTLNKLTKEIESEPDSPLLYRKRADIRKQLNEYEFALCDFNKAIDLDHECNEAYHERGIFHFERKNFELALDDFNKSIKLNPLYSESYLRRGVYYFEQEIYDLAITDFNTAIKLNPKSYLAFHNLANYYFKIGEYNLSLDNIDKAIELADLLETRKDYCFFAKSVACRAKKYDKAENYIKKMFENIDSKEKEHENIYLQDIDKEKKLEETNKRLELEIQQKEKALEDEKVSRKKLHEKEQEMISFFTHTLRNALASAPESLRQAIRLLGSEDYEKNKKYYKAINKITALFSTLSLTDCLIDTFKQSINDPQEFKLAWQKDNTGDATPKWVIASALRQSLNRIIFMSDASQLEKLLNVTETAAIVSTRKSFIETVLPLNIDNQGINTFYDWLNGINTIEISIEETNHSNFGINQVKFSLLFAITSEILLNALKYWNGTGHIQISWQLIEENYIFTVKNPCHANASSNLAGTHKGIAFINRLMELLGDQAQFNCLPEEQQFTAQLTLHKSLLGDNT